jgi:prepilin-type N-terminal cleavage/methylation domain-containing protein
MPGRASRARTVWGRGEGRGASPRLSRATAGGFTLIEVVVALVLMGILLVLAIPSLSGYLASRNLDLGGQQVVADLRAAEDRARTQHVLVRVTFTGGSGTYTVDTWSPTSGQLSDRCNLALLSSNGGSWVPAERESLPSGVTVSSAPLVNPLVFSCLGLPYSTAGVAVTTDQTVTIANQAGQRTAVIGVGGQILCVKQPGLQPAPCPY